MSSYLEETSVAVTMLTDPIARFEDNPQQRKRDGSSLDHIVDIFLPWTRFGSQVIEQ
jgi:hypothetical protein